ncbi:MAG: ketose-bisphosphate aldolase [Candidatus Sumerlaeia bacterium]|nr:ketose-bisphosphate aldolase [Candidatus Sumerlaeia bacterium]
MPLVTMRQVLEEAAKGGYGVGAFNVNNMEQVQAIMAAAEELDAPVILQVSRGALKYADVIYLRKVIEAATERHPDVRAVVHLDHGNSPETCEMAMDLGFTSVMMDGSLHPDGKTIADYAYNVEVTAKVVEMAHARGVTVEGELGALGGIEDGHGAGIDAEDDKYLTEPGQAVDFVRQTGIDCLAVAIGTSHGAYKTLRYDKAGNALPPRLALDRIEQITANLAAAGYKAFPLVMHGSSSVPQDIIAEVNKYGGKLKNAMGVPMEDIQFGIQRGVRKINVDTDGRLVMTAAIRRVLWEHPELFDPRDYLKEARSALKKLIAEKMRDFGQAGHGHDYEPIGLDGMRMQYAREAAAR